ncbi:hypothetical protein [Pelomonas cellulosilytica]|uniref:Restriction endonuclease n=1 Tax=Pelomonas cellulosilytica TaxID=2906762 RepID=A0ABS8XRB1_9BURK|nr:hypothetical protein [Pelomonas sp. P8]MCE4555244.1 hypothetical protein [Pelomonas sp. P8]
MDAVFTLPWPELVVAGRLQELFRKKDGYSVFIPTARQEKGVDLALLRKRPEGASRVATIQVKASRTYIPNPPVRPTTERFKYYTWFNRFLVPDDADFFMLVGFYPRDLADTDRGKTPERYREVILLLNNSEMREVIKGCVTVRESKEDRYFGFGFDDTSKIVQTRGKRGADFTHTQLSHRRELLASFLGEPR